MNEIPALTSHAPIERPDRDPRPREDPYGQRHKRQRHPAHQDRAAAAAAPSTTGEPAAPEEPPVVGSRLDVRA
ncbi:MAG: hypothetical protein AB7O67_05275 [Vicinamibacterales bacterium]